jgi:PAS domain S-box-containing protein
LLKYIPDMKHKEFQLAMDPLNELEKSRVAYSLKIIISVSIVLLSILSVARLLLRPAPNISDYLLWMMTGIIIIISIFSKRDKNRYAGLLYVVITWIPLTLLAWTHVGVKDIAVVGYIVCILFAMNITLYWQANTVFLLSIISIWGLFYAEYNHFLIPTEESSITYTIEYSVILGLVMVLLNINRKNQLFYYKSLQKEFNEKITGRKEAEEAIRFQSQLKEVLMNMATTYINLPLKDVESAIHDSLGELAEVVKADRITIFYYNLREHYATAAYEWTNKGIQPQISYLQKISLNDSTHWDVDVHLKGEPIFISDTHSLQEGDLRSIFEKAGSKSMLSVPLMNANECLGFLAIGWTEQHHAFTEDELKIMKVFALMQVNISIRKKSEESLHKSEEQFRDLVENINDVFFTLDKDGIITYISPQISQLYDYKPEDLIGHPFSEIIYADDLEELITGFKDTKENRVKPREFRYHDRDRQIRWAQTSSRPIMEGEHVIGVRGLFSDITNRKLAEQELQKLSMAVVQSPAIILITNLAGEIEYVNPRFCQVTGYTLGEVIGRNPHILKSGNTPKEVYHDLWSKITNGKEWRGELYNKKKNGDFYWEAVSITPIMDRNGKITHYLSVKEDITERKEATRRIFDTIIETEERERLRYSHELHDGLGPILSTINLYFQMLAENTETDQKEAIITRASSCIDEAIRTIKEISYNLSPSVLSNFGIVSGINNFINRLNDTEKLYIDFESNCDRRFEKNLEITIYRIITELINNTLKYANASRAGVSMDYSEKTSTLTIEYNDNGSGFDLEKALGTRKGLGLSNIYQRVNTLNGKINVETGHNKGIKVSIEFPIMK